MYCTKCGFEIKDGYKFCPKCGTPAYAEKEEPKGEEKNEDVDEVAKEKNSSSAVSEPVVKSIEITKKTAKEKNKSTTKEGYVDSKSLNSCIPNPLIAEELDIEGIKKKAEQGDKEAMLKQAFRYEMGIGVEMNLAKAEELYKKIDGNDKAYSIDDMPDYLFAVINNDLNVIDESK